jgi:hypothetical protein
LEENYRPDVLFVRTSTNVVRTSARVCVYPADGFLPSADAVKTTPSLPPSPPPSPSLPSAVRGDTKKNKIKIKINFFGSCCRLGKREKIFNFQFSIFNFQFSVFNPQNPRTPRAPRAPRASRAKPQEEEGFFGLVPLVTHPSSIPLLGGLTPKFLSLSLHSL